jgi:hypothetical protein
MSDSDHSGTTRRELIKLFGASMGALLAGTRLFDATLCLAQTSEGTGFDLGTLTEHAAWQRLREYWLRLAEVAVLPAETQDWDAIDTELTERQTQHQAAVTELVAAGAMSARTGVLIQEAFSEAAFHLVRENGGMTCYEPLPVDHPEEVRMRGRQELTTQLTLLREVASQVPIAPETVRMAWNAIERDVYTLDMASGVTQPSSERVRELLGMYDQNDVETDPDSVEAARIILLLLTGTTE